MSLKEAHQKIDQLEKRLREQEELNTHLAQKVDFLVGLFQHNLNRQDVSDPFALHLASQLGLSEIVYSILDNGMNPDAKNNEGQTALMIAAGRGYCDLCCELLIRGASIDLRDCHGYAAINNAISNQHLKVYTFLKDQGALYEIGCFFSFWAVPVNTLRSLQSLIPHEQAITEGKLVLVSEAVPREKLLFLSHHWLQDKNPDDSIGSKISQIHDVLSRNEMAEVELVWIDYMCVPQQQQHSLQRAIDSLAYYVRRCDNFVSLIGNGDRASLQKYNSRGWCLYEQFAAVSPVKGIRLRPVFPRMYFHNKDTKQLVLNTLMVDRVDPLSGDFTNQGDKKKIAPCLLLLCDEISKLTTEATINSAAERIRQTAEDVIDPSFLRRLRNMFHFGFGGAKMFEQLI